MWLIQSQHYRRLYHETVERERHHRAKLTNDYHDLVVRTIDVINHTATTLRRVMHMALPRGTVSPNFLAPPLRRSTRSRTPVRRYNPDPGAR